MSDLTGILKEASRWSTAAQFEGFLKIERKGGELVSPVCNVHQMRIDEVVSYAHEAGRPCRIVGLKPRQKGSSTYSVAVGHVRLKAKRGRGLIAGGAHFQGANLFKILGVYATNDELDPKSCKVMDMEARYSNGSTMQRITLANSNAGRSGTYQVLIITEVAYLAEEGVANATAVLNGLLKCVPHEPDTIIIQESTAKGAQGDFYETWQTGITLDEFKAGKNGYVRVFSAWFEFADSRMDPASEGIASDADLTVTELDLAARWGLDLEQIAWMRWALREECKGDWDRFLQDYPFDPETAFAKSGRCYFTDDALKYQEEVVALRTREHGVLEYNAHADRVSFVPTTEHQARCVRWETPRVGCRYLIAVDPMTGADQTGGDDPDSHAVFVLRAGYTRGGEWVEPAVVMRNMLVPDGKRFGCWWAIDVLEEEVWRMARYWQAIVCPEMNMDRGMVELLKLRGDVDIYQREMFNRREMVRTKALGWMTDTKTRPMILETLGRALREAGRGGIGGIEVRCPWAIRQMRNFVVKPNGRAEASAGHHDDDCFVAGTLVLTPSGEVPIETLRVGNLVVTRNGPRLISKTFARVKPVVANLGLVGTASHPVITPDGEKCLTVVSDSDTLYIWNPTKHQVERLSFTKARTTTDTLCRSGDNCVYIFGDMTNGSNPLSRFIGRFGLTITGRFQKAISFIISTATRSTTRLETLKRWALVSIASSIRRIQRSSESCGKPEEGRPQESSRPWPNGGKHQRPEKCILKTVSDRRAGLLPRLLSGERPQGREPFTPPLREKISQCQSGGLSALVVEVLFCPLIALPSTVRMLAEIASKSLRGLQRRKVYNIHVEDTHEYFANGILVHNCLALAIGVQLLDMAVPWREEQRDEWLPRDLRGRMAARRVVGTFS